MSDDGDEGAEALDPRVQIELERLNSATDEINRLEVELDESRLIFRRLLAEGHIKIQQLTKKLGTSVHKARPYYEARFRANITSQELQTATLAYDKANSAHSAAREMVFLAEQGLARLAEGQEGGVTLDPAWQEMLNHATLRVNQAESERASTALTQRTRLAAHRAATAIVQQLQNGLKRHITKSRPVHQLPQSGVNRSFVWITGGLSPPYFEEKARINASLDRQKARIQTLEEQVSSAKLQYSCALRNLETISDEIHRHRGTRRKGHKHVKDTLTPPKPDTDTTSDTNTSDEQLSELCDDGCKDLNIQCWLRKVDPGAPHDDTWTEVDLDYSSPEDTSFEKCSLNLTRRSACDKSPTTSPPDDSRVSAASPRRIITHADRTSAHCDRNGDRIVAHCDRTAGLQAELDQGRRPSLDALLHDTGERCKEMLRGLSLFGERRGSLSVPRTPRANSPHSLSDRYSDTDSLHSMEMLTDEQIASLMLDAQLDAVCEKLAGFGLRETREPRSPEHNGDREIK